MSLLPQRKKSPGEIAKLRETFGVSSASSGTLDSKLPPDAKTPAANPVDVIVSGNHQATVVHETGASLLSPEPVAPVSGPKPVHSLKRSERSASTVPAAQAGQGIPAAVMVPGQVPKPVRSLRKSERTPITTDRQPESPPDSSLPHLRHSDEEIAEIRRREVLALMNAQPNPKLFPAHPALIVPGYLCAAAGAIGCYFYQFPIAATAACAAAAILVALFIGIRKPISRHHAAFIAVFALFVIVFGALHYFPHLRHAT
ncbi:MAG: hypothetical protein Q8Q59_03115 [Luteolibacter sp.]|jgi:hypothetical protein|nr:hypothetical protein [Luteolibacter sp.]